MKTLVIFDVDGTLLDSGNLHHDLITRLLADDGLDVTFQPWSAYPHYTDLGVLDALFRHYHGRGITAAELSRYDELYEAALREHLAEHALHEIPGAKALLTDLAQRDGVKIAFATGSLRRMARLKLSLLGLKPDDLALATGGEHLTREDIVLAASALAMGAEAEPFRAVILGDGLWDQRTAAVLGIPFVALQTGLHVFNTETALTLADFSTLTAEHLLSLAQPVSLHEVKR
ncbi:HAD family hydrolase [Acidisoma cellulosilytica]|uniref:phosphoglycolate phosphatase n=1 Tax=Acidisoma cellulosilyticum TaxID=2802395 RepID=A0A963Z301_9PROT|nr:HAD family hydrolase [Acidisoma cellulosilyticum]MCB8881908.1 HAD family hydrolase [Acidisoma cellulosilyticum]